MLSSEQPSLRSVHVLRRVPIMVPLVPNRMETHQFGKEMCKQTLRAIRSIRHMDQTVRRIMDNPSAWNPGEPVRMTTQALANDVASVMVNVLSMRLQYPGCRACISQMDSVMISLRNTCARLDQLAMMVRLPEQKELVRAIVDEMRSNSWIQA